jgi:hypothetical protein
MEAAMRGGLVGLAVAAVMLAAPAGSWAAALAVFPPKPCYRSGEKVGLFGTGFTPNGSAAVALDGTRLGLAAADAQGYIRGQVTLGSIRGERNRSLTAVDQSNPGNVGALALHASGVAVSVRPRRAGPGKRVRVRAYGFTGSKRLYAHVRRGRFRRNVRIGRLKGNCRKLSRRVKVFSRATRPGVYKVQFDGKRRYSRRTVPAITYRVTVFRRVFRRGLAAAAAESWVRLR